ncbi:TPA: UTP--glucose-1-phosphate uridylyltransferase [Candidatus Dependentiae bacterium]|nr:MAG: UTP-glucose-1-phosphate uridylyltransferase [candidate division TM6 bacterium GW2011_GWE2_31_21]KKP54164.1 MAG: UTP-glucose-1-phosphate uridylyltransferase [candidate division TM6 bacterium GW2011_GWF2_33_332]HBS47886.1 UTP--glucose-1-phosphate uridylyltransferase [Candidatus Dependentiae bacterium]HBZ73071.1 UTP--glucose-1-phosphate uridylyltransferase [Candidatus Dependentiae bacterium]
MEIKKAIIPAAGLGTRFLPTTKVIPKEMLPLLDKPAIQWVVEEGVRSGIKNYILVTGKNKKAIEDHFDSNHELDHMLKERGQEKYLDALSKIMRMAEFTSIRQHEPLGLGHAVWTARHAVGKEHVAVLLPDDIFLGPLPAIAQLAKVAEQEKCNVIAVKEMPMDCISRYGVIEIKKQISTNLFQVKRLVEKPKAIDAPSNLAIVGRYILSPGIFEVLESTEFGVGEEIQLTDAIQSLILNGEKVFAYKVQGSRYDTGTTIEWLKSNIALALKHPDYSEVIMEYLKQIDRDMIFLEGKADLLKQRQL